MKSRHQRGLPIFHSESPALMRFFASDSGAR